MIHPRLAELFTSAYLVKLPPGDPAKSIVRRPVGAIVPGTELREDEGDAAADRLPAVEHRLLAHEELLLKEGKLGLVTATAQLMVTSLLDHTV